jgi:hypothetical protein
MATNHSSADQDQSEKQVLSLRHISSPMAAICDEMV